MMILCVFVYDVFEDFEGEGSEGDGVIIRGSVRSPALKIRATSA